MLIKRGIIAIASESIQLSHEHTIKQVLLRIGNHALEVRAKIGFSRDGAINIFADDVNAISLRIRSAIMKLTFYRLLRLVMGRISGVNDCIHENFLSELYKADNMCYTSQRLAVGGASASQMFPSQQRCREGFLFYIKSRSILECL